MRETFLNVQGQMPAYSTGFSNLSPLEKAISTSRGHDSLLNVAYSSATRKWRTRESRSTIKSSVEPEKSRPVVMRGASMRDDQQRISPNNGLSKWTWKKHAQGGVDAVNGKPVMAAAALRANVSFLQKKKCSRSRGI
jgi:hypothetical protein